MPLIQICCFAQDSIWNMLKGMIDRLSKVMIAALVHNIFTLIPLKISTCFFKKVTCCGPAFTNTFSLSNWVSIARLVACLPQASRQLAAVTAAYLETPCVCSCQSYLPKLCLSPAPRAQPLIFQSKPSISLWNSIQEWLPDNRQGLELGLKLELCLLANGL